MTQARPTTRRKRTRVGASWILFSSCFVAGLVACRGPRDPAPAAPRSRLLLRITGEAAGGELGFRFSPPIDVDGDDIADVAAGARFTNLEFTQMGTVGIWSTLDGEEHAWWEGHSPDALFGHAVLLGPDVDRDGNADVIAAAPNGKYHGVHRGVLFARSSKSKRLLWSRVGEKNEGLGWDLALAGDRDGDGVDDFYAGAPDYDERGKVHLISGGDGASLRIYRAPAEAKQFGWYVDAVPDVDGDGDPDLVVGAPDTEHDDRPRSGAAYVYSAADGRPLRQWHGSEANGGFGEVVVGLEDIDGDDLGEVAVGAPHQESGPRAGWKPGEVLVFSGGSGQRLFHWVGTEAGELYGRALANCGDVDGDGAADIAIGAPWSGRGEDARRGRFEVRSGKSGATLASVVGSRAEMWLGWHIVGAKSVGAERAPGLLVSALRSEENGLPGAGALHIYALYRP